MTRGMATALEMAVRMVAMFKAVKAGELAMRVTAMVAVVA